MSQGIDFVKCNIIMNELHTCKIVASCIITSLWNEQLSISPNPTWTGFNADAITVFRVVLVSLCGEPASSFTCTSIVCGFGVPKGLGVPNEWLGLGVPKEWLGFGVPWLVSAGVAERLICDTFGLTSPLASFAGDIGIPFASVNNDYRKHFMSFPKKVSILSSYNYHLTIRRDNKK